MNYIHGALRCPANNAENLFSLLTGRREYFWTGLISWYPMSDGQNEICITEEAVRDKTLQGGEVCTASLQGCGKNLPWAVIGATSSNLWTSTPRNSHIHRPHSCPSFTSPEIQPAVGRHSGALLCGVQRGEWALHMVPLCGRTTEVPSTSWALHIHAEGWGEDTKSSPPLNTMKSLR